MASGIKSMLKNDKQDELEEMYILYWRVDSTLLFMTKEFEPHVLEEGRAIVNEEKNKKDFKEMIKEVINLREKYDIFILKSFKNDAKFVWALDSAFTNFTQQFE